ncbi:MAG: dihydroneopterin aldolase [Candidatus Fimenecus sp.]
MDKIIIKGLRLYAYHGVNPEEKAEGQMFYLDITCAVSLCVPCKTDCVEDTVSYAKILKTARVAFLSEKFDLLERAAECVASAVLSHFASIQTVTVCVKKPQAPIKADFDYVAVEITRERQTETTEETDE